MIIDKFNNKTMFQLEQIKEKLKELESSDYSLEKKNYEFREFMNKIINNERYESCLEISNNIINKEDVETIFEKGLKYLDDIDIEIEEVEYLIKKLELLDEIVLKSLLQNIKNLLNNIKTHDGLHADIIESFGDSKFEESHMISTQKGFLELRSANGYDEILFNTIEILNSNGLPGDTHTAYISNDEVRFNGEIDTKLNINNIVNKEIFEYELITIPSEEYKKTKGYGFYYDEGIPFISTDNKLKLTVKLTMNKAKKINTLSFKDNQTTSPYIINKIKIITDTGNTVTIASNVLSNNHNAFSFSTMIVKSILLELEQGDKDNCYIGHFYNSEIKQSQFGYDEDYKEISIGSINNLGVTIDHSTKEIIHPKTNKSYSTFNENAIKTKLYDNKMSKELVACSRAKISLGNLTAFYNEYQSEGFMIKKYSTINPIKSITLEANEHFPNKNERTYIRYFISFNKEKWHSIVPVHRTDKDDIHTLSVNSTILATPLNVSSIFTNKKETSFYLKIELSTSDIGLSPIVNQVSLKINEWKE